MSINFNNVPNDEAIRMMEELFGKPVASDGMTNLFDKLPDIEQRMAKAVANAAGQPMTVEMNSIGDIKDMADGSRYQLTEDGWKKMEAEPNLSGFFIDEEARDRTADDLRALERFRLKALREGAQGIGVAATKEPVGNPTEPTQSPVAS